MGIVQHNPLWGITKKAGRWVSLVLYPSYHLLLALLLISCATPAERFQATADGYGFSNITLATPRFKHKFYLNANAQNAGGEELHVYLDGDGTPWKYERWLADDPTSREPLILHLMHRDPAPALLLGRPCYHGFSASPECASSYWTSQRYSRTVIDSLADALRQWLHTHRFHRLVLIGYSGGGTLAVLLAPYFDNTAAVLTVAANLDVAAWSRLHGYSTLNESLDPALLPPLDKRIKQIHAAGEQDKAVPPSVIKAYTQRQHNATVIVYDDFTHGCCWTEKWPALLNMLRADEKRRNAQPYNR